MGHQINPTKEQTCPYTGEFCAELAEHIAMVVDYYARLAKGNSSDIFTNGGDPAVCLNCQVYKKRSR